MNSLMGSIRRQAAAFSRLMCLTLVLASAFRCTGSDSITGEGNPGPENPGVYTVTTPPGFACESATAEVKAERSRSPDPG